jgi:hypothetical protein
MQPSSLGAAVTWKAEAEDRNLESNWFELDKTEGGAGPFASRAELTPMLSTAAMMTKVTFIVFKLLNLADEPPQRHREPKDAHAVAMRSVPSAVADGFRHCQFALADCQLARR